MGLRLSSIIALVIFVAVLIVVTPQRAVAAEYARWDKSIMPLRVYIERNNPSADVKPSYPVEVAKALREWKVDTRGLIDFVIVQNPKEADIVINWAKKLRKEDYMDQVSGHSYAWGITKLGNPTKITLVTKHPLNNTQSLTNNNVYMIALHEIGHSIGLWWHTRDPEDIMYPDFIVPSRTANGSRIIVNKNRGTLSNRDISNLLALYNNNKVAYLNKLPKGSGIQIQSQNNSMIGSVETTGSAAASVATKSNKLNVDLGAALAHLKENPNSVEAHNNIGLVYLENNDFPMAIKYFQKALNLNANYAKGHFNIALAYSKMKNYNKAIAHYQQYLLYQPNSPNSDNVKKEIQRLKHISMK